MLLNIAVLRLLVKKFATSLPGCFACRSGASGALQSLLNVIHDQVVLLVDFLLGFRLKLFVQRLGDIHGVHRVRILSLGATYCCDSLVILSSTAACNFIEELVPTDYSHDIYKIIYSVSIKLIRLIFALFMSKFLKLK